MKKTDSQESDFDTEMRDDPIVKMYKKILLDPAALQRSARSLETLQQLTRQRSKQSPGLKNRILSIFDFIKPASIGWRIPVSLATGVIVGIMVAPLWQSDPHSGSNFVDQSASDFRNGEVPIGQASSEQGVQSNLSFEEWSDKREAFISERKLTQPDTQPMRSLKFGGEIKQPDDTNQTTRSPKEWLTEIATLISKGRISQAEVELRDFKFKYPNYQKTSD